MKFSEIELPSNKKFGILFSFIFLVLSLYFYLHHKNTATVIILIFLSLVFLLTSLVKPSILKPLNVFWMSFGLFLGMIISPIVIGFIFYLIFSPLGIFMKLFGRDELRIKRRSVISYWKKRESESVKPESFKNQF